MAGKRAERSCDQVAVRHPPGESARDRHLRLGVQRIPVSGERREAVDVACGDDAFERRDLADADVSERTVAPDTDVIRTGGPGEVSEQ